MCHRHGRNWKRRREKELLPKNKPPPPPPPSPSPPPPLPPTLVLNFTSVDLHQATAK